MNHDSVRTEPEGAAPVRCGDRHGDPEVWIELQRDGGGPAMRLRCDAPITVRIGATGLRVTRAPDDDAVDRATAARPVATRAVRAADIGTLVLGTSLAFIGGLALVLPHALRDDDPLRWSQLAYSAFGWTLLLAAWATPWMFASRLGGGLSRWRRHVLVAGAALFGVAVAALLLPYAAAALALPRVLPSPMTTLGAFATVAACLHLAALPLSGRRLALACLVVWIAGGVLLVFDRSGEPRQSETAFAGMLPVGMLPIRTEALDQVLDEIDRLHNRAAEAGRRGLDR
jgi:hypothetical protein